MKYPEECPVFEIARGAEWVPAGMICVGEGYPISSRFPSMQLRPVDYPAPSSDGAFFWPADDSCLVPLTRAAREMLALVQP